VQRLLLDSLGIYTAREGDSKMVSQYIEAEWNTWLRDPYSNLGDAVGRIPYIDALFILLGIYLTYRILKVRKSLAGDFLIFP